MSDFTIDRVMVVHGHSTSLGPSVAHGYVEIGPIRLHVSMTLDGDCAIDMQLHDRVLRSKIAIAFRKLTLDELISKWERHDQRDKDLIEEEATR